MSPDQEARTQDPDPQPAAGCRWPALGAALFLAAFVGCGSASVGGPVAPAPSVSTPPADLTVLAGATATFTAAATGSPTYQWTRGGLDLAGAMGASYTTPPTAAGDDKAVFAVKASNAMGTATSAGATLRVNYVTITAHPADLTPDPGQPATFTVTAASSGALAYQWRRNGSPITGATQASFTLAAPAVSDDGAYGCVVTSVLNGTTATAASNAGQLTLKTGKPVVTVDPAGTTVLAGTPASFAVSAPVASSFQWYVNGRPIPGATEATYTTPPTLAPDDHSTFYAVASNAFGTATSATATLRVNYILPGTVPASLVVPGGQPLTLNLGATAGGTLTCQWLKDGQALAGATATSLTLANPVAADAGAYTCALKSALNGTTQTAATSPTQLLVVGQPVITRQPVGGNFVPGDQLNLILEASATGAGNVTYQWFKDGVLIPGGQSPIFIIQSLAQADSGSYTCVVGNARNGVAATVTSLPAVVNVRVSPSIRVQPFGPTVSEGSTAAFNVVAEGPGTLAYQWYKNGASLPGATSPAYTTPVTTLADNQAAFHCVVSNGNPPDAVSADAILTVKPMVPVFAADRQTIVQGQGIPFPYLFSTGSTATFGPRGGTAVPVQSGRSTVVYPTADTTYDLTVSGSAAQSVTVAVKTYTPTFLYLVNQGSNDIYQYPVNPASPLAGSAGLGYAYDDGTSNLANALVGKPLAEHTSTGKGPVHMAATADEKFIYVANAADSTISAYSVDHATGRLTALAGSPYPLPAAFSTPWCTAPDPLGKRLYVGCPEGVAVMDLDAATGALTYDAALALPIPGKGQGDVFMHPSGKFLFVADSGHSLIKSYAIDASGALAPAGPDGAVAFKTGINPYLNGATLHNPSCMTVDRAGALLFTRSTDPTLGNNEAAIDSFAINPYSGALTSLGNSQGPPDSFGYSLVGGLADEFHGLSFAGLPGVDHLYEGVQEFAFYWQIFSDWTIDMDPASATYGRILYYSKTKSWSQEPHWVAGQASVGILGSAGFLGDRSGRVFAVPCNQYANTLLAFGSGSDGSLYWMGSNVFGETTRPTGTEPVHGLFIGTLK